MKFYENIYSQIVSVENLFMSWDEFKLGKLKKRDVLLFESHLEEDILKLHRDLKYHNYKHDVYYSFCISDPKQRTIHKATVRDRVLHHAIFRVLNPLFETMFIADSFSCRLGKGNHKGNERLSCLIRKVSRNYTGTCYVLKCDIKKFFDSIDHQILLRIIKIRIKDPDLHQLLDGIIGSFGSQIKTNSQQLDLFGVPIKRERERESKRPAAINARGIPIGNLTSQLFANVYMNEFDQFMKHELKVKHYCRYTDDFVIVSNNRKYLEELLPQIETFLQQKLELKLHPEKVYIRKYQQGIDFLGYVVLPHHNKLRTKTKRRIFAKLKARVFDHRAGLISEETLKQSLNSYLGVLSHASTYHMQEDLKNHYWYWLKE